ncbi:MAG: HAD-IIIC family phosphatase [Limisphaerales bacterium]
MSEPRLTALILSSFNVAGFCARARNDADAPLLEVQSAPVARLYTTPPQAAEADVVLVWTLPDMVLPAFKQFLDTRSVAIDTILAEVDGFCHSVERLAQQFKQVFLPTWMAPDILHEPRLLDMNPTAGVAYALMRMNLRLAEQFAGSTRVLVLNSAPWTEAAGKHAFSSKLWHLAKVPFGNDVFKAALRDLKSALAVIQGRSRKVIILDLDDTLWGGTLGEVGSKDLNLGGHDAVGEAHAEFQRQLLRLSRRGILLAIASKNEVSAALEAIAKHPEMVLRLNDFAAYRINWEDKAKNVADILGELNLPASAAVFIDNNPAERERIRMTLPQVLTPDWPADPMLYSDTLLNLRCFETIGVTADDLQRTGLYQLAKETARSRDSFGSVDEWIASLDQQVTVEAPGGENQPRVLQLINKTNQMNLATRRLTEAELSRWLAEPNHQMWALRVTDKFGSTGLVGVVSIAWRAGEAEVVDFLLSCRVIGRKVEEVMVHLAARDAKSRGAVTLRARLVRTDRNEPCRQFWKQYPGIHYEEQTGVFTLDLGRAPAPMGNMKVTFPPHDH